MKFGIFDQNDASGLPAPEHYAARLDLAEVYDSCGFHIYHMSEHHSTPLSTTPSPSVFLAAVAQRTKRIRLGPLVYILPLYNPLRLVEEICMLDGLSNGRFEIGIGRGASPHEVRFMGVAAEQALDVYREVHDIVMQGLTQQRLDYRGVHFTYEGVPVALQPVQKPHPPVWYVAGSADSAIWPARQGYNVIASGPLERVRAVAAAYKAECVRTETAQRSSAARPLVGLNRFVVVADTDAEAKAVAARAWKPFVTSFWRLWRDFGGSPATMNLPESIDPVIAGGGAIVGSPDTVRRILAEQIAQTRVTYFEGSFVFGDMGFDEARHSIELFAREVMPPLEDADAQAWDASPA
jgi:alkanesulfonate monooxygenase SsuD/methylene tetrahydromethanopterin reductase-like flavin-dependent oxidoreductase (luciferase family)